MHCGPQVPAQRPPTAAWESGRWTRGRARIALSFMVMAMGGGRGFLEKCAVFSGVMRRMET
jgi:hypothetical protein